MPEACPCGSDASYKTCCGKYIDQDKIPATPEALMRSRYTAFTQVNTGYIAKTMVSPAIDAYDEEETKQFASKANWEKLEIIASSEKGSRGMVEFKAHYSQNNNKYIIHEISDFVQKDGAWFYVDGVTPNAKSNKVGRNDPCTCGSGKKYKKCCG